MHLEDALITLDFAPSDGGSLSLPNTILALPQLRVYTPFLISEFMFTQVYRYLLLTPLQMIALVQPSSSAYIGSTRKPQ